MNNKNNKYVWHPGKCANNIQKHHIDFADAVVIFEDPRRIERRSDRNGEERCEVIGAVNANILLVAYAVKEGGVIRIISARRASRNERKAYYQI
jgi:uncharacterized DUF497 family protein